MATSLSSYWVKFFTGAGFPLDVATKHAVVFSNNRIKPDMLPDLDKPSLKEMGITLMGDMIAILRYAKKVSEDMTCERFLVDTVDETPAIIKPVAPKVAAKKVASKVSSVAKKTVGSSKNLTASVKPAKTPNSSVTVVVKKKPVVKVVPNESPAPKKRKITEEVKCIIDDSDEEWPTQPQKRLKVKLDDSKVDYQIIVPKKQPVKVQEPKIIKKPVVDHKRTVFDRLGDSSVTSTTSTEVSTTFNITGLGSEILKRHSSVFNRLGDRDANKESAGILKNSSNGGANGKPLSILKNRVSNPATTTKIKLTATNNVLAKKNVLPGTMRADHEKNKKIVSGSVRQLVRKTKAIKLNESVASAKAIRKIAISKLASDSGSPLSAKARLGLTGASKQVTFNKVATVAHIKKPCVFSRLGV